RRAADRHRQHGVHHLQLARDADRFERRAEHARGAVPHRWQRGLRHHRISHRHVPHVADGRQRDAQVDSRMTALRARARRLACEEGTTLIETTIACGLLLVVLAGLLSVGTLATMHTENQGHLTPRTTEYSQDKMEQLLSLAYGNTSSNTVVFPTANGGGSRLAIPRSPHTTPPPQP